MNFCQILRYQAHLHKRKASSFKDFQATVLQSSMEDSRKLGIRHRSTGWQIASNVFPLFRNSISPTFCGLCGKNRCHPSSTFETTTSYNFL